MVQIGSVKGEIVVAVFVVLVVIVFDAVLVIDVVDPKNLPIKFV